MALAALTLLAWKKSVTPTHPLQPMKQTSPYFHSSPLRSLPSPSVMSSHFALPPLFWPTRRSTRGLYAEWSANDSRAFYIQICASVKCDSRQLWRVGNFSTKTGFLFPAKILMVLVRYSLWQTPPPPEHAKRNSVRSQLFWSRPWTASIFRVHVSLPTPSKWIAG